MLVYIIDTGSDKVKVPYLKLHNFHVTQT